LRAKKAQTEGLRLKMHQGSYTSGVHKGAELLKEMWKLRRLLTVFSMKLNSFLLKFFLS